MSSSASASSAARSSIWSALVGAGGRGEDRVRLEEHAAGKDAVVHDLGGQIRRLVLSTQRLRVEVAAQPVSGSLSPSPLAT